MQKAEGSSSLRSHFSLVSVTPRVTHIFLDFSLYINVYIE